MKTFINDDFLLGNKTARRLYHQYAEDQPIIDFHCHLSPQMIADDRQFDSITQAWLEGDHYKWRAMRTNGIDEKYCTGKASDEEKFRKWAETVPVTIGNPLYHWTHLELARYFGIFDLLSPETADSIYKRANELLRSKEYSIRSLLTMVKAEVVCTTDDPADNLEHHKRLKGAIETAILPTWRPDNVIKTDDTQKFINYIERLGKSADIVINDFNTLVEALENRHKFFHEMGGRCSDHGLDRFFFTPYTASEADKMFKK
ncbi:MAG: glucuronate isomerase, partial [Bacteroidales bacterium]|nr:glucuronate isomerase [Bacteroidales bacterium]